MARRRQTKWARQIMEDMFSGPSAPQLSPKEKEYVQHIVEGLRPLVVQQGERSTVAALEMCNLILANMISRRADFEVLKSLTKENLEIAMKSSDRTLKTNTAVGGTGRSTDKTRGMGIGSRMKPLLKIYEGAIEEALVETVPCRQTPEEVKSNT